MNDRLKSVRWVYDCLSWKANYNQIYLALSSIQLEERERLSKFVFLRDAKRSLVGRLLMRKYIQNTTGIDWDKFILKRDSFGKPYFENENIQFNVSHSGCFVVFAAEIGDLKLGIDVMKLEYKGGKSTSEFFRIMSRNFSVDEWSTIKESNDDETQLNMFYRYWCLKESYGKAIGKGVTLDFKNINFKINTKNLKKDEYIIDTQVSVDGIHQPNWVFQEVLLNDNYCCCVAINSSVLDNYRQNITKFKQIYFEDIQKECKVIEPVDNDMCRQFLNKNPKND